MFVGTQQQAMMPLNGGFGGGGFGTQNAQGTGGFAQGAQGFGANGNFGFPQNGAYGANDPMGSDATMMALGRQTQAMGQMMTQMMEVMGMFMQMMMMKQMQAMMSSMSNFGGSSGGGSPGIDGFLGGGGTGGGTSSVGGSAPSVDPGQLGDGTAMGKALAKYAGENANGPGGYCYKWVAQALAKQGVKVTGASAYMAADQLAKNDKFREVSVNPKDLAKLPAGAVVVWNKGSGHPHGHISIALGNGKEASDKLRTQITNYGTSVRVFLPK